MNENELIECIELGMSHRQIATKFGKSQTSIRYWLDKFNLKTDPYGKRRKILEGERFCSKCDTTKSLDEFHQYRPKGREIRNTSYCKSCTIKDVLQRQINFKLQCLDYKGKRECNRCGYNKSYVALEFHHRDPNEKDFAISKFKLYKFVDVVKDELDKCDVLCSNCHKEVHHELSKDKHKWGRS